MAQRKIAMFISISILLLSLSSLIFRGMEFGLDFTGGTILEVAYPDAVELHPIRDALKQNDFTDAVVQHFGSANEVLVRVAPKESLSSAEISTNLLDILQKQNNQVQMRRVEFVGPQVGEELTETGGMAMLAALGCILK